jgi:hypothetical protein
MMCLAENYGMCQWGNDDSEGLPTGGWSDVYSKCDLYMIPAVNSLSGYEECTNWCKSQKENVEILNCLRNNADMCHWG